ncbi:MAG: dTDP-glucose 4,6-dehydratase [Thermotogae bacterium]|nr:dTDP-glucose 4,6-dehydratase [Thermotogota bacterium]
MVYLVTGGAGFIGSNFVRYLLKHENDAKIIVLDALTYAGSMDNLREFLMGGNVLLPDKYTILHPVQLDLNSWYEEIVGGFNGTAERLKRKLLGYEFREYTLENLLLALDKHRLVIVVGNIVDRRLVGELMRFSNVVVHFAAETHVDRAILNAEEFVKTDVYGTFILLDEARSVELRKFVYISTDEVYGVATGEEGFDETAPLNPRNPYSASKAAADRLAYSFYTTYGVPVVILRPSNNFGPYQYPEKLIPVVITRALNNEHIPVYGDGKQRRDWLYVEDTARAVHLLIERGKPGEAYNVAGHNEKENIYIVRRILDLLGKSHDLIRFVEDRPGHDRRYSLKDNKLRKLGFENRVDFEKGLEKTVRWYVENSWWWKKILASDEEYQRFRRRWYAERMAEKYPLVGG